MPDKRPELQEMRDILEQIATQASGIVTLEQPGVPAIRHPLPAAFAAFAYDCVNWYRIAITEADLGVELEVNQVVQPLQWAHQLVLDVSNDPAAHYPQNFTSLDSAARRIQQGIDMLYRLPGRGRPPIPGWPRRTFQAD
jgi:hypothetical protein